MATNLDEIRRREATEQGNRLEQMTRTITLLSWAIFALLRLVHWPSCGKC